VTQYCSGSNAAITNDDGTYTYKIGTVTVAESAKPTTANVTASEGKTEADLKVTIADETTKNAVLDAAANIKIADENKLASTVQSTEAPSADEMEMAVKALTALDDSGVTVTGGEVKVDEGKQVRVVKEAYLDVTVEAYNKTSDTMTVDITPKYNLVATTATTDAKLDDKNSVAFATGKPLTVTGSTTVTVPLPADFAKDAKYDANNETTAYIIHDHNGTKSIYNGTVKRSEDTYTLTFTTNGFSSFTMSMGNPAVAQIGDVNYYSLQDAVNAVQNGETIKLLKNASDATVSKTVYFTLDKAGHEGTISAGGSLRLSQIGDTYNFYSSTSGTVDAGDNKDESANVVDTVVTVNKDGSTTTTVTTSDGTVTTTNEALNGVKTVTVAEPDKDVTATVTLPAGVSKAVVSVPVANVTAGTVAVDENGNVVKLSVPTKDGLSVAVTESTTLTIVDNSRTYSDVADDYWGADYIAFASSHELFKSTGDNVTFEPETQLSRYMLMTILARLDDQDLNDTGATWYEDGMAWAVKNEISDAYNGTRNVTREEMVTMLWRYAGKPAADADGKDVNDFADADSVSEYAKEAMAWAVSVGIINGGDNGIDPQGNAKRSEVAKIMMKYCEVATK
jgi:hypothetical protein